MLQNYFKTASRSLLRNKQYAIINITGLAVGIAVCIIIFLVIQFHTGFDTFHAKQDRICRIVTETRHREDASVSFSKDVPFPLPAAVKVAFPQVEKVVPVWESHNDQLILPGNGEGAASAFKEQQGIFFTTASFFDMFDFPLLAGSYTSLNDPNNVLLTKETAEKYFGDWKQAIGKTIHLEAGGSLFSHSTDVLKVTGVLASIPPNSDFQLKLVVAYGTGITEMMRSNTDWQDRTNADFGCYVLLPSGVPAMNCSQQLQAYTKKFATAENRDVYNAQPLGEVHFDTQAGNYSNKVISHELINALWLIAGFILFIACVNFINLSTAQAVNRAKEVGVRKVLGSNRVQLQFQFIGETFLIVFVAVLMAAIFTFFALPPVNRVLETPLSFNIISNNSILLFLLVLTVAVTLLAGFYPSLVLSGFNPVTAFKSKFQATNSRGISLRRGLVTFQFAVAQVLIIGTFVIVKQMHLFINQPLGFNKDAVINVPFRVDSLRISRLDYLRDKLLQINGVTAVSYSSNTPVENGNDIWSSFKFDHADNESGFKAITKFADDKYMGTYQLQLVAGRNLQPSPFTREFLVNESMVKSLGLKSPEEILNKEISIWSGNIKCPVVGVLKDFNDRSFRHSLAPLLIATNNTMYSQAGIKLSAANLSSALSSVKTAFDEIFPGIVYEYTFLDDKIEAFYKQENQLAQLYTIFSGIAVFLSCLGLYGLALYMTTQRKKEVGVRKVLGANAANIVYLFSKEFILLIIAAFVIAVPVAWYYMHQWLQDYVYRIHLSWWLFATGGFAVLVIALAATSLQAIRAARTNPVTSLRTE